MPRLVPRGALRLTRKHHYYSILNEDEAFLYALAACCEALIALNSPALVHNLNQVNWSQPDQVRRYWLQKADEAEQRLRPAVWPGVTLEATPGPDMADPEEFPDPPDGSLLQQVRDALILMMVPAPGDARAKELYEAALQRRNTEEQNGSFEKASAEYRALAEGVRLVERLRIDFHMPQGSSQDIVAAYQLTGRLQNVRPHLLFGTPPLPNTKLQTIRLRPPPSTVYEDHSWARSDAPSKPKWIVPYHPEWGETRIELNERFDAIVRYLKGELMEQADKIEGRLKGLHSFEKNSRSWETEVLQRGAQQLNLRVNKRYSWGKIASEVGVVRQTVKDQVTDWAASLGIPLH